MKKCIIFPRVSTEQQSYEEQKAELIAMALSDGYTQSQLVIIENKESAIKLDEEHREGIVDMKKCIDEDKSIDCVYIWEVSRWARKKYILFNLQHFLLERKIQLKVKNPSIVLLDENGNLNASADWMFTIFAQLAETEMTLKVERFKRAKRERKREGFKIGSQISYGYKTEKDKKIIIDEEQAEVVRKVFELYHTHSIFQICNEMKKYGVNFTCNRVTKMLRNRAYISDLTDNEGLPIFYPRILSDEQFNEVQELLKKNTQKGKERLYSLCARLIKCPECGHYFMRAGRSYKCSVSLHTNTTNYSVHCGSSITLPVQYMDRFAFECSLNALSKDLLANDNNKREELKIELSNTRKRKEVVEKKLAAIQEKKKKQMIYFDDEIIDYDEYRRRIDKIKAAAEGYEQELVYLENKYYNDLNNFKSYKKTKPTGAEIFRKPTELKKKYSKMSDEDKYNLTHKYIKQILVRRLDNVAATRIVEFQTTNGLIFRYMFSGSGTGFYMLTNTETRFINKPFEDLVMEDFIEDV